MSLSHSVSTKSCLSRAIIPLVPESVFGVDRLAEPLPTVLTFMVNPQAVHSPQTGYPWFVETDREMGQMSIYSLIPQKNNNQYVSHYRVESRRPRFVGDFHFIDAWLTTNHRLLMKNDTEIHFSQTLFNPERADDKLYFDRVPKNRIEVIVPNRFIEDRELWTILEGILPEKSQIQPLVQRQS